MLVKSLLTINDLAALPRDEDQGMEKKTQVEHYFWFGVNSNDLGELKQHNDSDEQL